MKKKPYVTIFLLFYYPIFFSQTKVFGYIKDEEGKAVEWAEVDLIPTDENTIADKIGYFQFVDLKPGNYKTIIFKGNYETVSIEFEIKANEKIKNLGNIILKSSALNAEQDLGFLENLNFEDENESQNTIGLLQSSQDIFNKISSYDLGFYWFRPRGNDGRQSEVMFNGISMNKPDNGNVDFINWGGLNEITRYPEITNNHSPSEYAFGGSNSVIYKNTKASEYRRGNQITYSITNRNYRHRFSYRYSSGMNKKGWAFTGMIARRWAQEGIQEGTFYDAYGIYLGIEKQINEKHSVTLNTIAAPYTRSTSSPNTQEVYNYRGINYNSYWGWQNGKKRSERIKTGFQPIIQLTDYWKINEKTNMQTSISYQFGKIKSSRLDWQNALNPSPTYYRNLPSYWAGFNNPSAQQKENLAHFENSWKTNDSKITQINWQHLYLINMMPDILAEQELFSKYKLQGKRAKYYLVEDIRNDRIWNFNTHFTRQFNERWRLFLNLSYKEYNSEYYREVKDLLGADYALNIDPFSASNHPSLSGLFNEGESSVGKKEGDKIGYNYILRRTEINFNPGIKFNHRKFDIFLTAKVGYITNSREGLFRHYLYSNNSLGKSPNYDFIDLGMKGQIIYKINGRNFVMYNSALYSQAPYLDNLFINARLNNFTAPLIKSTLHNAHDINYIMNAPLMKLRASGYFNSISNNTFIQRFFADGIKLTNTDTDGNITEVQSAFVTQMLSNINKKNIGIEIGTEVKVQPTLSVQGLISYGTYVYDNNPNVYLMADAIGVFADGKAYKDYGKSYLKGYRQGGTAQKAYSLGIKYNSPKFWWIGANWNYLGENYLDPSAIIRSDYFVNNPFTGTPYSEITENELRRIFQQRQLPNAYFINLNMGKSWLLGKLNILITASINNVLNNKKYITSGFEQIRNINYNSFKNDFDRDTTIFSPKYWYTQGRSYFINFQIRF